MTENINNIEERLRLLIQNTANSSTMWKDLEERTGIQASSWVDFNRGKKRATAFMIEAICQHSPEYSLWLVTGADAPELGQISPTSPYLDTVANVEFGEMTQTKHYLRLRVEAAKHPSKHNKGMAAATKELAHSELQYYFWGDE